jgi:pimeloyl-ACP methyl ester carboxylesterase
VRAACEDDAVPRSRSEPATSQATREVLEAHRAAGRSFEAGGVRSFVRERGDPRGGTALLLHGVPTSSFLYRKVMPALADEGMRSLAVDLPGLGLAERPEDFDYTWSGLARWLGEAIDALGIDDVHLVVHDIGGPIGCEWAVRNPARVLSLTALNTMLDPASFRRPWSMAPFAVRGVGAAWLRGSRSVFRSLFYAQGIADRDAVSPAEVDAHYYLLRRDDGGRAFLRIMRGFELTADKRRLLWGGLAQRPYPARIVWGEQDPALGLDQLEIAGRVLGVDDPIVLPAKHFLQEDHAAEIAAAVADLAAPLG